MWAALVTADGFLVAVHSRSSLTMGFKPTCFYAVGFALLCVVLFCVVFPRGGFFYLEIAHRDKEWIRNFDHDFFRYHPTSRGFTC